MSDPKSNPRAEASRRNGRKSKGPATTTGKERASRNALKHGLRAKATVLLEGEDGEAFQTLDQGLKADLQPSGPLETLLTSRLAMAAWRMDRADRIEADLLTSTHGAQPSSLGEKVKRDRHGPQAIDCLIRYRGTTQAEFWRTLAALRSIQNQRDDELYGGSGRQEVHPIEVTEPRCIEGEIDDGVMHPQPNEPESR